MSEVLVAAKHSPRGDFYAASSPTGSTPLQQPLSPNQNGFDDQVPFASVQDSSAAPPHNRERSPESSLPPWMHNAARAWLVWRWRMANNVFAVPLPYWTAHWDVKRGDLMITLPIIAILIAVNAVVALSSENVGGSGSLPEITLAFVFIFAVRNNSVLLAATGISFERALFYHKVAALVTIVLTALHGIAYLLANNETNHKDYSNSKVVTGSVAFFAMVVLYIFALNFVRRRFFDLFLRVHWILFIVILLFTVIHGAVIGLIGAVPWIIDMLFRVVYRPRVYANGTAFSKKPVTNDTPTTDDAAVPPPSRLGVVARDQVRVCRLPGGITSIQFPRVRADTGEAFKFKPGQYAFLCIPDISMLEWHPFSLSSAPHEDVVTFHIRSLGDWTSKLASLVSEAPEGIVVPATFDVFVDGPYGSLSIDLDGHVPTINYSQVVMISGGIGITPMRSIANQLYHELHQEKKRLTMRSARLVWAVRDFDMINAFMTSSQADPDSRSYFPGRILTSHIGTPTATSDSVFRTDIFVTDISTSSDASSGDIEAQGTQQIAHLMKLGERPDITQILRAAGERAQLESATADRIAVLVCGPEPMVTEAINASIALTRELGVHFDVHHEYFSF